MRKSSPNYIIASLFLAVVLLSGCARLKEYSRDQRRREAISIGGLEGMDKVDIISKFGQPLATSKSDLSECWYYKSPREVWIWFDGDKVRSWEAK